MAPPPVDALSRSGQDDGYLAVFVFDPVNARSDFVLLDAAHVDDVAVVRLPQRVPQVCTAPGSPTGAGGG
jgi:carotenoid cleavage dioxygenase-like enzyme